MKQKLQKRRGDPLGYLGLAARSGSLVTGTDNCIEALKRRKVSAVVMASDASPNAVKRAEGMLFGRTVPLIACPYDKLTLSDAVGSSGPVVLAAICDEGLAAAFASACSAVNREQEERNE